MWIGLIFKKIRFLYFKSFCDNKSYFVTRSLGLSHIEMG
uniref:Uncharacterized protein n=1 Tax=Myoviridae sp. ctcFb5 TaxID=2825137 RepID=A0A8S5PVS8_9CAUD|nr:MAG TPA: hypothetical protein [Myoviridae sp. ctcFb5]DAT98807.1 MAG TPA: hypothetical protein [Caudoviricetes sp.]